MTVAPDGPVASVVTFDNVNSGAVVSRTVMLKLALALLPALSVASQFTVVVPRAKVLPDVGEQLTATAPLTRSLAVGEG